MKTKILILLFFALSSFSCVKEIPALSEQGRSKAVQKPMVFVTSGPGLDSISVFDGFSNRRFERKNGPTGLSYYGEAMDSGLYRAVAPYQSSYKMESGRIKMVIPKAQRPFVNGLDSLHSVFAASTDNEVLTFARVSSAASLSIEQAGLTSVTLRGNNSERLAGNCVLDFNDGINFYGEDGDEAGYSVSIKPEKGTLQSGKYLFSLLPTSFKEGVSLTFTRAEDSRVAVVRIKDSLLTGQGTTLDLGKIISDSLNWNDVISLLFMEVPTAKSVMWPFNEGQGATTLTTKEGGNKFIVSASSLNETRAGAGFVFGPSKGDYIQLPNFNGKALTSVRMVTGNSGAKGGSPALTKEDGTVLGDAWTEVKQAGDEKTWSFRGEAGIPVRLALTEDAGADGCAIQILELQYREARENEYFVDKVSTSSTVECNTGKGIAKASLTFSMSRNDLSKYAVGFEYRDTSSLEWQKLSVAPDSTTVSAIISGLQKGKCYELRAWAKGEDDKLPKYGESVTFVQQTAFKMIFGNESSSTAYYNYWNALWSLSKSSSSAIKGPDNKQYSFCDSTYTFILWSSCGYGYRTASSKYYGLCLAYSGSGKTNYNGWMILPVMPGMKLSKVVCKMQGSSNYDVTVASAVDATSGTPTSSLGSVSPTGSTAKEYTISVKNSESGKAYYLCTGTGLNKTDAGIGRMATFETLTLIYE